MDGTATYLLKGEDVVSSGLHPTGATQQIVESPTNGSCITMIESDGRNYMSEEVQSRVHYKACMKKDKAVEQKNPLVILTKVALI